MANLLITKIIRIVLLILLAWIFHSCCILKNYDYTSIDCQEIPREAIDASVHDYYKHFKQRKPDSTAIFVQVLCTSTNWFFVFMNPFEVGVDKFPIDLLSEYTNQIPPSYIPTEYVENGGILYAWHNSEKALTEDVIAILVKYHLVLNEGEDWIVTTGEGGFYYIFCTSNPKKYYRRVIRDWGTPLPKCNCH